MSWKLGSLFDGSGGFPLAGVLSDIEPKWASEVEPYPIAVTRSRFPNMKHLGDISKVNGAEIEPVDIITFGSPCQDLSVAGKRAGLKHEANGDEETTRSGLFMEAVRIIKEMREATNGEYPRFALWENVPGAFSSNKGEDFRIVLEELIKIVEPTAAMPTVPPFGWPYADSYSGNGWSLAYRVFDAQFWGVPQRRRRIHLVADFRGQCAREVLFEREGLRGYFAQGGTPWEGLAAYAEGGAGADHREGTGEVSVALSDTATVEPGIVANVCVGVLASSAVNAEQTGGDISPCLMARAGTGGNQLPLVAMKSWDARGNGDGDTVSTITGDHENRITDYSSVIVQPTVFDGANVTSPTNASNPQPGDPCHTLSTDSRNYVVDPHPVFCLQGNGIDRADTAGCNGKGWKEGACYTLNTIDRPAVAFAMQGFGDYKECGVASGLKARDYKDATDLVTEEQPIVFDKEVYNSGINATGGHYIAEEGPAPSLRTEHPPGVCIRYIVRRLTPTECARLQGFADSWGHIDEKDDFTEEEYRFWQDVRNTHAEINGKAVKDYTKKQMLTWYNKLHTDSAEYKMWGNGIALPPALYCMQGIAEVLEREEE